MGAATEEPSIATIVGPGWSAKPWLSSILVIRPELRKKIVGTRCFPNETGGTVRVFYPAEETNKSHKPAGWFGVSSSLGGYLGGFLRCKLGGVSSEGPAYNAIPTRKIIPKESVLFDALSLISRGGGMGIPANRAKLPCCFENLKAGCGFGSNGSGAREGANTAPMLLWSHGLTGTGEEHALFATMLAAEGIVVAVVQHSDGTSPKVKDAQGKPVYYQHADFRNYDTSLRQRQLEHRVREISSARSLLLSGGAGQDLQTLIDPSRIAVGGFSFGAATAALVASRAKAAEGASRWGEGEEGREGREGVEGGARRGGEGEVGEPYRCAVMWDGFFRVELKKLNVEVDIPLEAHAAGIHIPALFLGSAEFARKYPELIDATHALQAKCVSADCEKFTVPGTIHQNFTDLVWWFPPPALHKFGFSAQHDSFESYLDIVTRTRDFLKLHLQ